MAYPGSFLRLVVSGTLYGTEQFAWSLAISRNFETDPAPDTIPQALIDAVVAYHSDPATQTGARAELTMIKLNEIGPNGRYANPSETVLHEFETPVAGEGNASQPPQTAVAVTLRTAVRRGLAKSGRFYLPHLSYGPSSDGRMLAGQAENIATATTTFLQAINPALGGNWAPAVTSDVREGAIRKVTHCEVGRVLDTIRSRRSSLEEDYQVGAPLAP